MTDVLRGVGDVFSLARLDLVPRGWRRRHRLPYQVLRWLVGGGTSVTMDRVAVRRPRAVRKVRTSRALGLVETTPHLGPTV